MKYLTYAFIGILAIVLATAILVFNGFVLSTLWAWFAVPAFAVPAMSIPVAMGLALIFNVFSKHSIRQVDLATPKECIKHLGNTLMIPAVALLYGFVITLFM